MLSVSSAQGRGPLRSRDCRMESRCAQTDTLQGRTAVRQGDPQRETGSGSLTSQQWRGSVVSCDWLEGRCQKGKGEAVTATRPLLLPLRSTLGFPGPCTPSSQSLSDHLQTQGNRAPHRQPTVSSLVHSQVWERLKPVSFPPKGRD